MLTKVAVILAVVMPTVLIFLNFGFLWTIPCLCIVFVFRKPLRNLMNGAAG